MKKGYFEEFPSLDGSFTSTSTSTSTSKDLNIKAAVFMPVKSEPVYQQAHSSGGFSGRGGKKHRGGGDKYRRGKNREDEAGEPSSQKLDPNPKKPESDVPKGELEAKKKEFQKNINSKDYYEPPPVSYNNDWSRYAQRGVEYSVLMVAEKPSIAKSIAEALAGYQGYESQFGEAKMCPVHQFMGYFKGIYASFKVTSVTGHVFNCDFPDEYQDWKKFDPITLFEAKTEKKEAVPANRIIRHLEKQAKGVSFVCFWLDCDREGENICFEVKSIVESYMYKEKSFPTQFLRARFSSITKHDIREAYEAMNSEPNLNESISVDARQIIDLKIGVSFSRFQTMYFTQKFPDLNQKKITFGPCQTPTLGFCVKREDEMKSFVPKTFYRPVPTIILKNDKDLQLEWENQYTFDENECKKIKNDLDAARELTVVAVDVSEGCKARPEGLNTVNLLKVASTNFGIGPQQAMHIAERLYLEGYLTYPRTESTSYTGKFDFLGILKSLTNHSELGGYAKRLLNNGYERAKSGKDVGDHPPITPTTKVPELNALSGDERRIYEYVARHYMATISPDARFLKSNIAFKPTGLNKIFYLKGTTPISQGFLDIMPWINFQGTSIPEFKVGEVHKIVSVEVVVGKTSPPTHLTESELLTLMETHGIGTDASMPTHINNICEREYVRVEGSSRKLVPTELGRSLVHGYKEIDPDLVAPELRAFIESSVSLIAKGEKKYEVALREVLDIFKKKYLGFVGSIKVMEKYFTTNYATAEDELAEAHLFSKCGNCSRFMKRLVKTSKLFCEKCQRMMELPLQSAFKLIGDKFCPLDKFQLIAYHPLNQPDVTFLLCPNCYSQKVLPDQKELPEYVPCFKCPQKDCEYSLVNNHLGECDVCDGGVLVLDYKLSPKRVTVSCNNCTSHFIIGEDVASVTRLSTPCETCTGFKLKIVFQQGKGETFQGCVFCDEKYYEENVESKETKKFRRSFRGRGRGRGRGRKRGGRGKF